MKDTVQCACGRQGCRARIRAPWYMDLLECLGLADGQIGVQMQAGFFRIDCAHARLGADIAAAIEELVLAHDEPQKHE